MLPATPLTEQISAARDLCATIAGHFDHAYYAAQDPDLTLAGGEGTLHFLIWGWRQGLNPSAEFDVAYYLRTCPDVAAAGINPLVHYLRQGKGEGRLPRRPPYPWLKNLEGAWSRAAAAASERPSPRAIPMLNVAELRQALDRAPGAGLAVVAGPAADGPRPPTGWRILGLRSCMPHTALAPNWPADRMPVDLALDGAPLGGITMAELMDVVAGIAGSGRPVRLLCHHLAGFAPEHLAELAEMCPQPPQVWREDAFLACPSPGLLRNDLTPCGAPPLDSAACTICCHGPARVTHLARLTRLLARADGGESFAHG